MYEWYFHWKNWGFGKTFRLNGTFQWGYNPYNSYRLGPIELRKYFITKEKEKEKNESSNETEVRRVGTVY
jgi:hypothetical protein